MKQIYSFEQENPPALCETLLRARLEQRRLRRQTALLAAGGILFQFVILALGLFMRGMAPLLTLFCVGTVLVSTVGAASLPSCTRKGEGRYNELFSSRFNLCGLVLLLAPLFLC